MVFEVFFDGFQEFIRKIAVGSEVTAIFKIDNLDIGFRVSFDGFFFKFDTGVILVSEIVIRDKRSSSALKAGDVFSLGNEATKAQSRILWWLLLEIGWFVSFVDNDETEIF